ncbi:thiamine pyrophosphate-dependent dehydrogenase E1 component subunit alpha [Sneathiella sp.]|uniref:thiamine pyrophosphate-dependent dehydrogenase E1 component subunit alpha n=1 Tax=Sneathiella sp. TaxID=1964365 RepID=UPI0039E4E3CC
MVYSIGAKLAQDLSRGMRRIRSVEETIAARYSEQEMRCPTHLSSGQEGVSAAIGTLLRHTDLAVSGHRAHAHYLAKGGNLNAMIAEIYGRVTGCARGKGGSMHLIDETVGFMGSTAIVGGTVPVGVGLGYSQMMKDGDDIACVFLGDAVVETGVFFESLSFAALKKLPVLFICENNFYSVYSPLSVRQNDTVEIHEKVAGFGVYTDNGDGHNVIEVHEKTAKAIAHVRAGNGPAFLEFETFRWREHCGPNYDDDLGYRPEAMLKEWEFRDAIHTFEKEAINSTLLTQGEIDNMQAEIDREVDAAFEFAKASEFPPLQEASQHILAPTMEESVFLK